ncbi:MAG: WYL domain-containing protein [Anaerolineae bacterium]
MRRGKRESTWLVARRCLAIIRRVQRGPASRDDLLEAALSVEEPCGYGQSEERDIDALHLRLEKDLQRIRDRLMVDVYLDRQAGGYVIKDTWLPLLDLPDEDLEILAWLEQTFDVESPKHDEIHNLLRRLRLYLDPKRVRVIEEARTALEMDLRRRDEDEIRPDVLRRLRKAYAKRRQIELLYLSPGYEDGKPRRHTVEPYEPYTFDTTRKHYYLRAYCRQVETPEGTDHPCAYRTYRLGRILAVRVLPQKLPPIAPTARRYEVVYELTPTVARMGVTRQPKIDVEEIEHRDDGSAVVHGETESIFWAVQSLLHYGANCQVLGGPEMRRAMERVVKEMAAVYETDK